MKLPHCMIAFLLILLSLSIFCTTDPVGSGGGSGTDIVCQVYDSSYCGIDSAVVTILPSSFIPGVTDTNTISSFHVITDADGKFRIDSILIDNLSDSLFTITISHKKNIGSFRNINFKNERAFECFTDDSMVIHHFVLEPNGKASGHIVKGPENKLTNRALVFVPGTDFSDTTDENGKYVLDSLPTKVKTLSFLDLDTTNNQIDMKDVDIQSGSETSLDTVSLNGIVLLLLQNNFPKRLDTLYTLDTPKQINYLNMGSTIQIKTPTSFNGFEFVNWELTYGSTTILADSLDSTSFIVDSNSIVKANYRDIAGPDSIENLNIDVKGNQVTFTWSPTTDNDTVKEYCIIYRYQSDSSIVDTFTYKDTIAFFEGLAYQNAAYTCTLKAIDPSGNSSAPKIISFNTEKNDSTPPIFNSEIMIQKLNATYATIYWNPAVDGLGIKKYEILINDIAQTFRTETFYGAEGLVPGVTYNTKIRAYDYYDNISNWIEKDITMPLINDSISPTVPIIDSNSVNGQEIYFSWQSSTDNVSDTLTYEIKYAPLNNSSITPVFINLSNVNEYKITGLESATTYEISIRAYDLAWYFSDASTIQITTE